MSDHIPALSITRSSNTSKIASGLFYSSLATCLVVACLMSTLIPGNTFQTAMQALLLLSALGAAISFLIGHIEVNRAVFCICLLFACFVSYFFSKEIMILVFGCFVCAANNGRSDNIMKTYLLSLSIPTVLVIILSKINVIPSREMSRITNLSTTIRDSMGFNHPNALAANLFIITIAFLYLYRHQYKVLCALILISTFICCFYICNSRTYSYALLITGALWIIDHYCNTQIIMKYLAVCIGAGSLISSFVFTALYGRYEFIYKVDQLLSTRISLGSAFMDLYPITPFGQQLEFVSSAESFQTGMPIMLLDNSFLRSLYAFGYITFVFILVCYVILYRRAFSNVFNNHFVLIILITILICCCFEGILFNVYHNPLILFAFAAPSYRTEALRLSKS